MGIEEVPLEILIEEQKKKEAERHQRPQLELPLPIMEPPIDEEEPGETAKRGVVIIGDEEEESENGVIILDL